LTFISGQIRKPVKKFKNVAPNQSITSMFEKRKKAAIKNSAKNSEKSEKFLRRFRQNKKSSEKRKLNAQIKFSVKINCT